MDATTVILIAIPVLVVLAGVVLFASARRRDTGEAIGALAARPASATVAPSTSSTATKPPHHGPRGGAGRGA